MKILFKLISLAIIVLMLYLITANLGQVVKVALFTGFYQLKLAYVTAGCLLAGLLAGLAYSGANYIDVNIKLREYQRKLEKTSVQSTQDSSKVEVLEAKIATLEKALQSALEDK